MKTKRLKIQLALKATYWEDAGVFREDRFVTFYLVAELNCFSYVSEWASLQQGQRALAVTG